MPELQLIDQGRRFVKFGARQPQSRLLQQEYVTRTKTEFVASVASMRSDFDRGLASWEGEAMSNIYERPVRRRSHNRIAAIMIHSSRFAWKGQAKLAKEIGVSKSTMCRLVNGRTNPSYSLAAKVARALSKDLGRPLDLDEIFSSDGTYPTAWVCKLVGCRGCLPERSHDGDNNTKPEWLGRQHSWTGDNQELKSVPVRGEV